MVFYVSLRMSARSRRSPGRGGSAKAVVGSEGALQGYRRVHDSAAFVPDGDNRQKGRPPRGVDDMGGVVLRKRGMWVVLGGWGLERFGLGDTEAESSRRWREQIGCCAT